jgi:flavin reductase (DIM6/NTAB) family NADH-FMN oxidoreductase RutF
MADKTSIMETSTAADYVAIADRLKEAMASVCTPVSVVTGIDGHRPHGTTVSAFASLSMNPPMVLVSLDRGSNLLEIVRATGKFGVNILGSTSAKEALNFARKNEDKFDGVEWAIDHGVPRLSRSAAWVACEVADVVDGGDHVIVLGAVVGADHGAGEPLTYYRRAFGTHRALAAMDEGN